MVLWAAVAYPQETSLKLLDGFPEKKIGDKTVYDRNGYYVGKAFLINFLKSSL